MVWNHIGKRFCGHLAQNWTLNQCLFGEHLLLQRPDANAFVDSSKMRERRLEWCRIGFVRGLMVLAERNTIRKASFSRLTKTMQRCLEGCIYLFEGAFDATRLSSFLISSAGGRSSGIVPPIRLMAARTSLPT